MLYLEYEWTVSTYVYILVAFAQLIVKFPVASNYQEKFSCASSTLESVGIRPFYASLVINEANSEIIEY